MTPTESGYEIRVRGHLDESWQDSFEGLALCNETNGEAVLTLAVPDPALLHGVLARIRDLNLPLLAVRQVNVHRADGAG